MPEDQDPQPLDLPRYLDVVRRRYPYFLVSLLLGWFLVWATSWVLPPKYKSATLILVEQPTMPKDYVTPNVNEDLQGRLQNIEQQILSRTRLLHIIEQLNLYTAGSHHRLNPDEKVERMRNDIVDRACPGHSRADHGIQCFLFRANSETRPASHR